MRRHRGRVGRAVGLNICVQHRRAAGLGGTLLLLLLGALPHGTMAQLCGPPPAGVVGWWPGDANGHDISGHANHAQLLNGAQAGVPGYVGGALQFDGVDDVAETAVLLPPQGTIELWLSPASLSDVHGLIGTFGLANGNDRLWMVVTGPEGGPGVGPNRLAVNLGSSAVNDLDIANPLTLGTWTHLAVTFDYTADDYILYVDGQAVAASTAAREAPTQAVRQCCSALDLQRRRFPLPPWRGKAGMRGSSLGSARRWHAPSPQPSPNTVRHEF